MILTSSNNSKKRIAYNGIEGAFASIAARKIFPNDTLVSFQDFRSAYQSVEKGKCDFAVLPIENSFAGEVSQVSDLMFHGSLFVTEVYELTVVQNLLGVKGTTIDSIKSVVSHPHALEQCSEFIREHGYQVVHASNTALGAKQVADQKDITLGAIASIETAKLYNLEVLEENINESEDNRTRFAVFSRYKKDEEERKDDDYFIMMFTVANQSGSLAKALNVIGDHGFNMTELRSRPQRRLAWEYYFFVEAQGSLLSEEGRTMVGELSEKCELLKILGSYQIKVV